MNEVRSSFRKVMWVTKWSYTSETSVKWQMFCSCSWQAIDTHEQKKWNINLCLDTFYLSANFLVLFLILQHSSMHSIVARHLHEYKFYLVVFVSRRMPFHQTAFMEALSHWFPSIRFYKKDSNAYTHQQSLRTYWRRLIIFLKKQTNGQTHTPFCRIDRKCKE